MPKSYTGMDEQPVEGKAQTGSGTGFQGVGDYMATDLTEKDQPAGDDEKSALKHHTGSGKPGKMNEGDGY